ncbi:MAG: Type phosphodiesterase / nucleotide pyrophosphatase [Acidobacteriota bacterium]
MLAALPTLAEVQRVVVLKIDGLPPRLLQQNKLPWIERVFGQGGTQIDNFYVRGLSLSAPSWSLLDTGRPLEIHGNVEYDRYTLRPYDYLNFVPFYFSAATSGRVDMRGVELLDEIGVPLLLDRFQVAERHQTFQLLQRGVRWETLTSSLKRLVAKAPGDLLDEWIIGMSISDTLNRQYEQELVRALQNPNIRYLDYFSGEFDHVAHLTHDAVSQRRTLEELDALVGRIWTAIQNSPLAANTALVLVSDHGMTTTPGVMSQGYNLVDWFSSKAGGAHNVLTNRHPLSEFKVKGLDPFVSAVVTPTTQSDYLNGQGATYPTVMLDLDGNERASIGLRNNTFNTLQIFLEQLTQKKLPPETRVATIDAFFEVLGQVRSAWTADIEDLNASLTGLNQRIELARAAVAAQPKKWTKQQIAQGLDKEAHRAERQLNLMLEDARDYAAYTATIARLLVLTPADFDPGKFKITDLIPARSLGPANTVWDLQHYITGPGPAGFVLTAGGQFDWNRSFTRVDYLQSLHGLSVRNNVQAEVGPRPVDFIAIHTASGILLYGDEEHQALIESENGKLRYRAIAHLAGNPNGSIRFDSQPLGPGFPLAYFEDPNLSVDKAWLSDWHTPQEWLSATHRTRYSNAILGLAEQLEQRPGATPYQSRKRQLRRTDLLVLVNDHWNFNVRGFNPGGNHGSFFRDSTHSVLLFAGGAETGIPRGAHVTEPYDSLSFVPTILQLLNRPEPDLPGPVIKELLPTR